MQDTHSDSLCVNTKKKTKTNPLSADETTNQPNTQGWRLRFESISTHLAWGCDEEHWKWEAYLHFTQQSMVTGSRGEVLLKDRHSSCERHMAAATKQRYPREAENGCHERSIWHSS